MPMDLKDKNVEKNKHFLMSVEFAVQGVKTVFEEERNMRKHVAFGILALFMGVIFQLDRIEWLWLLLAVFLVWIVEIINTVLKMSWTCLRIFIFIRLGKNQRYGSWSSFSDRLFYRHRWVDFICP